MFDNILDTVRQLNITRSEYAQKVHSAAETLSFSEVLDLLEFFKDVRKVQNPPSAKPNY